MTRLFRLAAVCALLLGADVALAQSVRPADDNAATTTTYYRFAQPGELTIQVSVVGAVRQPGLYEIAYDIPLNRLVALAGGPALDRQDPDRRRDVTVKLLRPGMDQPLFYATLDQTATFAEAPTLDEGDTIVVEIKEKTRFGLSTVATVAGVVGGVALLIQALTGN